MVLVDAHARVELERLAAGRGFGIAEHDADLLANLVGENAAGARLGDDGGELAHRGAHQAGLCADGRVADLAFEFLLRHERGHGIEHDDIERVRAHERLDDAQRLLAGTRLRDEQIVEIHAEFFGVLRIERVLDIHEGREPAQLLRLRDERQRERGLSRRLRPEDFDDAPARKAAATERAVDQDVARRDHLHVHVRGIAEAHDGSVSEILCDLLDGEIEVLVSCGGDFVFFRVGFGGHMNTTLHPRPRAAEEKPWRFFPRVCANRRAH